MVWRNLSHRGFTSGVENWRLRMGAGGDRGGRGGKEMWPSAGMWEPLLRFIGVGILWTEALFMVKPLCLSLFIR